MKKLLWVMISLVFVLVIAAGAVVGVVMTQQDQIKTKITEQISAKTGRTLSIKGDVSVKFWPKLAVSVADVSFANHEKSDKGDMVKLESLDVVLAVKPLLNKQVEIEKFVLVKPQIILEVFKNGQNNWTLTADKATAPKAEEGKTKIFPPQQEQDLQISFGEMAIQNARIFYYDHKAGTKEGLDDLSLKLDMPAFDQTAHVTGDLTYGAIKADYDLKIDTVQKIIDQAEKVGVNAVITLAGDNKITWNGGLNAKTNALLPASVSVDMPNFPELTKTLLGEAVTVADAVKLETDLRIYPNKVDLNALKLTLDQHQVAGNISVAMGKQISITTQLKSDQIDLDPILAKLGVQDANAEQASTQTSKSVPFTWSDAPIDFSTLSAHKVSANLNIKKLGYKKLWLNNVVMMVKIGDGRLYFDLKPAQLAEGTISTRMTLNAASKPADLSLIAKFKDVQAKPVLTHWAGFDQLSGLAVFSIDAKSKGNSLQALVNGLNGAGKLYFKNGALEGVNASNMVQMVQQKMTNVGLYSEGRTEFVHTGGTYTIKNGILYNKDFNLEGPLVLATGQGQVDLPAYQLKYRVKPELVVAQTVAERTGIVVPVDLVGRLDDIQVKPDYASVIKNALDNPQNIEKGLKNIKNQLGTIEDDLKKDPAKAIESIFGGF